MLKSASKTSPALTTQKKGSLNKTNQQSVQSKMQQETALTKWLDFWATPALVRHVSETIEQERQERIYNNQDAIDYGYSFPGLNTIRQSCLETVRGFCEAEGTDAVVADLGAGLGNMTWKLLAAGAHVDAFELNETAAQNIKKRIRTLSPKYWNEKSLDNILTIIPGNILTLLSQEAFREKYDFIWIGNVLHFLNPEEIKHLCSLLNAIVKPGGQIFAETNSFESILSQGIQGTELILNAIHRAQEQKQPFPGFVAFNTATVINHEVRGIVHATHVSALNQQEMASLSIPFKTNGYGKGHLPFLSSDKESKRIVTHLDEMCTRSYSLVSINSFHQIMNLLDEPTAQLVFTQAGFTSVHTSKRNIQAPNEKHQGLNVVARKGFRASNKQESEAYELEKTHQDTETSCLQNAATGRHSLLVDEKISVGFRRPYSLSVFAPKLTIEGKMELFSIRP